MRRSKLAATVLSVGVFCGVFTIPVAAQQPAPLRVRARVEPAPVPPTQAAPAPAHPQKLTFLGVDASPVPDSLRTQLKLKPGVALVIDAIDPGGPAEQAGLKPRDVIEKVDDQLIVNVEQFTTLIRTRNPGDEVTVTFYRDGRPRTVKAKLGQREAAGDAAPPRIGAFDGDFQKQFDRRAWEGIAAVHAVPAQRAFVQNQPGKQDTEWADEEHSIHIERENGKTLSMVITDRKTGKTLFEGRPPEEKPLDEFLQANPALREKIKQAQGAADAAVNRRVQFFDFALNAQQPGAADVLINNIGAAGGPGQAWVIAEGRPGGARGRVATWQDDDHLFLMRFVGKTPVYLLALSRKDGRTLYDGPVMTDEQRGALPAEIAEQFAMIRDNPDLAKEFGGEEKK